MRALDPPPKCGYRACLKDPKEDGYCSDHQTESSEGLAYDKSDQATSEEGETPEPSAGQKTQTEWVISSDESEMEQESDMSH